MGFFLEVLIGGLLAGVLYSLVALGFVLIFKASGVFNFAQGAMVLTAALALVRALDLLQQEWHWPFGLALAAAFAVRRRRHGDHRLGRRAAGAAQAGEPGRHHPVHGHDRRHLLPRGAGPDRVRRRRLSAQYRPAQGADLHPRIAVRRRHPGERARHLGGRDRRPAGRRAGAVLPAHAHRPRAARRGRRPCRRPVGRHSAQPDLVHRLAGRRPGGAGRRARCGAASSACSSRSRCWR